MKTGAVAIAAPRNRLADFVALTKPRLNSLVVVTTGVGYLAGRVEGFDPVVFAHTTIGAALVAGGAAALNQIAEHDLDERMLRARDRPTPAGRLHPTEATWFAVLLAGAGLAQLAFGANLTAAVVVFATLVSYAGIYTPSKRRTHWAVLVGAVPGALPVVIGWAAAGPLSADAWALFALAFVWQLPHFLHNDSHDRSAPPRNAVRRRPIHRPSPGAVQGDPPLPAARLGAPASRRHRMKQPPPARRQRLGSASRAELFSQPRFAEVDSLDGRRSW